MTLKISKDKIMKGKFTIFKGKDNQYYFNLKATNHEIILQSEGYKQKQGCLNGIESVKMNSQKLHQFEQRTSVKNEPYFVLKASNGEIIGVSEMYSSKQAMKNGINSVMVNGDTNIISDMCEDEINIIINGRPKTVTTSKLTFKHLIEIVFGEYLPTNRTCYTVTYSNGCLPKTEGSLVAGEELIVKHKMIINVTATDKS